MLAVGHSGSGHVFVVLSYAGPYLHLQNGGAPSLIVGHVQKSSQQTPTNNKHKIDATNLIFS